MTSHRTPNSQLSRGCSLPLRSAVTQQLQRSAPLDAPFALEILLDSLRSSATTYANELSALVSGARTDLRRALSPSC